MFPESMWVANDVCNQYVSDEDGQRLFREFLDELSLEDSLGGIYGALDRLERAAESSSQEPDSQEPLIEEPDEQETVVEEPEQKKVDTSESKLQQLLENVLKK